MTYFSRHTSSFFQKKVDQPWPFLKQADVSENMNYTYRNFCLILLFHATECPNKTQHSIAQVG